MRHYEESRWVDYVRGLADANAHQELKSHLEAGCPECSTTMELFRKVAKAAAHEIEHEPPEYAVHSVKAYFALQQTERQPASVRFLGLKLAFDSLAEPVGAGIRSLGGESRQLVYYANDYALTLRMDYDTDLSLGGELLHRDSGPVSNVPALLLSGHTVLGYSLSGELGDFHLTCSREKTMRLRMLVDKDELIEVDLDWPQDLEPVEADESAG
jgi:hypothetical protein